MSLINQFVEYLYSQNKGSSRATVKNYRADIGQFVRWFESNYQNEFDPKNVTLKIIENYKQARLASQGQALQDQAISARSVDRHLSSLRKFFTFLKLEGHITNSPFDRESNKNANKPDLYRIKDFKNYLYVYNASHLTIKNYVIDVKQFIAWAEEVLISKDSWNINDKNIFNRLNSEVIQEYKNRLIDQHFSPLTVNRKLSSLRKYLAWAGEEGLFQGSKVIIQNSKSYTQKKESLEEFKARHQKIDILPSDTEALDEYSGFAPIRLVQKIKKGIDLTFDKALFSPIAGNIKRAEYFVWKLHGKPIFQSQNIKNEGLGNNEKNINTKFEIGNLPKEMYAPFKVSITHLPWHKKALHHVKYTRPNWYRTYHSYAITHYFHFAILIIFMSAIGFSFYNEFIVSPQVKNPALAAVPTAPPRILSFQGRLTDNSDNPVSSPTALRFAIYDDLTASGAALLWQEIDTVSPDPDGIFSILLGNDTAIPSTLFTENASLYLGVTVTTTPELTPRQQLATVAYATNAETLQGLLPITAVGAGTDNVVLALDSSGNLSIGGSATPVFQATGGEFTISGNVLTLTTVSGTDSNIQLNPDGLGIIDLQKPLQNTTNNNNISSAQGAVEVDDRFAILATSSGQSAFTLNQNGNGDLISASSSGAPKFTVGNSGNVGIGTTALTYGLNVNGTANFASGIYANGSAGINGYLLTSAAGGANTWTDPSTITGSGWWQRNSLALSPKNITDDLLLGGTATSSALIKLTGTSGNNSWINTGNVGIGTTSPGKNLEVYGSNPVIRLGDNRNLNDAGWAGTEISALEFYTNDGSSNGTGVKAAVKAIGSATSAGGVLGSDLVFYYSKVNDAILYEGMRINLGNVGIGTTSPLALLDVSGNATMSGNLTLYGGARSIQTTAMNTLSIGGSTTGNIVLNPANAAAGGAVLPNTTNVTDIGSSSLQFRNIYATNFIGGSSGVQGLWQRTTGSLAPTNITDDLLLGATATSSALVKLTGTAGNNSWINTGNVGIGTTAPAGLFDVNGKLTVQSGGNVGIGTTAPSATLDVVSSADTYNAARITANSLTSGTALYLASTATGLTTGSLLGLDWSPGSATTATGDLFSINIGSNGTIGNLFNIKDNGSSLFSVSETAVTSNLPSSFTSAGDVSMAYDLLFTNPTASYIKSSAPLYIESGETFNSSDLTLRTYNKGNTIVDSEAFVTNYAATVSSQLVIGTNTAPGNIGGMYLTNSSTFGKALAILNQTESQDIFTASASGTTKFTIGNNGNLAATGTLTGLTGLTSSGTITFSGLTTNGGVVYTNGSGVIAQTAAGTSSQCLLGGGPTWGDCSTAVAGSVLWTSGSGAMYPKNSTLDLFVGGSATSSAKFSVLNINSGTPTASVSATATGTGLSMSGAGTIQSLLNSSLTIGGNTTGNIALMPLDGSGNVGIGTTSPGGQFSLGNSTYQTTLQTSTAEGLAGADFRIGLSETNRSLIVTDQGDAATDFGLTAQANPTLYLYNAAGNGYFKLYHDANYAYLESSVGNGITFNSNIFLPQYIYPSTSTSWLMDNGTGLRLMGVGNADTRTMTASQNYVNLIVKRDVTGAYTESGALLRLWKDDSGTSTYNSNLLEWGNGSTYTGMGVIDESGNVGIGTTDPSSLLSVGSTSQFQVNSSGAIAAATGLTSSGTITFSGLTTNGGVVYTNGSGVLAQTTAGTSSQCLLGGGPSWGDCSDAVASSVLWTSGAGAMYPKNSTMDLFVGGSATSSAKFSVLNINSGTPTASVSATATGTGLSMSGAGTIQSLLNSSLTIGGDTTGNIALMPLNGSGNVGIGTTSPAYKLQVAGNIGFDDTTRQLIWGQNQYAGYDSGIDGPILSGYGGSGLAYSGTVGLMLDNTGNVGIGTTSPGSKLSVNGGISAGSYFGTAAPSNGMIISGNVGIGTTSPQTKLQINYDGGTTPTGTAAFGGLAFRQATDDNYVGITAARPNNDTTQAGLLMQVGGSYGSRMYFATTDNYGSGLQTRMFIQNNGNVGIGTTAPWAPLTVNGAIRTGTNSTNYGGMSWSSGLYISTYSYGTPITFNGGTLYIASSSTGNVGIGTTNPGYKLDVNGTINSTGYYLNGSELDLSGINYWGLASGALYPSNTTNDVLVGGSATSSALIKLGGTPNASTWFNTGGNVGIGTTAPTSKLQVAGNITPEATGTRDLGASSLYWNNIYVNNIIGAASGIQGYWQRNTNSIAPTNITDDLLLGATATSSALVKLTGTAGNNSWINTGNVGIGTTAPTYNLEVSGADPAFGVKSTSTTSNPQVDLDASAAGGSRFILYTSGSGGVLPSKFAIRDYTAGSLDRLVIDSSGNVGIGTTSPLALLDVAGNASTSGVLTFRGTTDPKINVLNGENFGIQTSVGGDAGLTERLTVLNNGNVGIGTTSPGTLLDINDDAASGTGLRVTGGGNGANLATFTRDIGSSGTIGINSSGGDPQIIFTSASNAFALGTDGTDFKISDNAAVGTNDRLTINSTGNVGIGTTSPLALLDVAGAATIGGQLTFDAGNTIQTTGMNTLTLGGSTTGNIVLNPGNAVAGGAVLPNTTNVTDIGSSSLQFRNIYATNFIGGTSGVQGLWQRTTGSLAPTNITDSLNLGAIATSSALVHLAGTSGENSWINTGNVGIGTTSPSNPNGSYTVLDLSGSSGYPTIAVHSTSTTGGAFFTQVNDATKVLTFGTYGSANVASAIFGVARANNSFIYSSQNLSIGTSSTYDLTLGTNSTANVTIQNGGNVGIGTTNPLSKLDVRGQGIFGVSGAAYAAPIASNAAEFNLGSNSLVTIGESVTANANPQITLYRTESGYRSGRASRIYSPDSLGTLQFDISTNGNLPYGNETYANIMTLKTGGNVGIGTTSPNRALEVVGSQRISSTTSYPYFEFVRNENAGAVKIAELDFYGRDASNNLQSMADEKVEIVTATDGAEESKIYWETMAAGTLATRMTIKGGNVGIGSDTTPDSLFSVGSTSQFQVNSSGAIAAATGLTSSGTITFSGFSTNGGVVYTNGSGVLAQTAAGTSSQCLLGGGPSWGDCSDAVASSVLWTSGAGAMYPKNSTMDLFVGGTATSSAKFSVLNMTTGTPTASVSATAIGTGLSMSGAGTIQSLLNSSLTIGGDTTGNIALMPLNGSGNVGIGTTAPLHKLQLGYVAGGEYLAFSGTNGSPYVGIGWDSANDGIAFRTNISSSDLNGTPMFLQRTSGNVGIGTTNPGAKLDVAGNIRLANDNSIVWTQLNVGTGYEYAKILGVRTDAGGSQEGYLSFYTKLLAGTLSERMRIDQSGNVGIGTTSPGVPLDVWTNPATTNTVVNVLELVRTTTGTAANGMGAQLQFALEDAGGSAIYSGAIATTWEDASAVNRYARMDFYKSKANSQAIAMSIDKDGYVGIGTTSPAVRLVVAESDTTTAKIHLQNSSTGYTATDGLQLSSASSNGYVWNYENAFLALGTNNTERLNIGASGNFNFNSGQVFIQQSSGNVGIGTTSPGAKLDVSGTVRANFQFDAIFDSTGSGYSGFFGKDDDGTTNKFGVLEYGAGHATVPNELWIKNYVATGPIVLSAGGGGTSHLKVQSDGDIEIMNGNVGINNTSPLEKLDVSGNATMSGNLTLYGGARSIQATAMNTLSIGGSTTGNIVLNPANAAAGGAVLPNTTNVTDIGSSSLQFRNIYATNFIGGTSGVQGLWQRNTNAISPTNITDDLLLGATATSSALIKLTGTAGNNSWINTGNVGIGTTGPSFPLSFGTAVGNKIALYDAGSGAGYGFGIQSNLLQIFSNAVGDDITFGYGNSASMTRNVTFKGSGNVGIGKTNPSYKLDVSDTISTDKGLNFNKVTAPGAPTATLVTTTGNVTAGDHKYRVTFVTATGETNVGTASNTVTTDGTHAQVDLTNIPTSSDVRVTGRKIYRTKISNTYYTYLLTTINDNTTTTYTDNTADGSLGTQEGTERENTTAGQIYVNNTNALLLGSSSLYFGLNAGNTTSGGNNTFIGPYAGYSNTTGSYNTYLGLRAGYSVTSGGENTLIGMQIFDSGTVTGSTNTVVGTRALRYTSSGSGNSVLGGYAGYSNTTGGANVYIGYQANYYNETGTYNTIIGYQAGKGASLRNISGNVFLGYQAGFNETGSNKLYIENSNSDSPLIWGDFSTDTLGFNGNVGIGTTSPEYLVHLKSGGDGRMLLIESTDGDNAFISLRDLGTSSDSVRLGVDSNDMVFWAGNTQKMVLTSAGNVGIGTTTPLALLDVAGAATIGGQLTFDTGNTIQTTAMNTLTLGGNTTGNIVLNPGNAVAGGAVLPNTTNVTDIGSSSLQFRNIYATNFIGGSSGVQGLWQRTTGSLAPTNITDSLNLGAIATSSALVHLAGTSGENSWINTGNVGIGTTNPGAKLNLQDTNANYSSPTEFLRITRKGTTPASNTQDNSGGRILFQAQDIDANVNGIAYIDALYIDPDYNSGDVNERRSGDLVFSNYYGHTSTRESMRIKGSSGNVGVGTTSPGSKLSVNGGISAGSYFGTAAPSNGMIISGNVGIGTTGPSQKLELYDTYPTVALQRADVGIWTDVSFGGILWRGQDNAVGDPGLQDTAWIKAYADGSWNGVAADEKSRLVFGTLRNRTDGVVEAMRITSTGNVGIGTTDPSALLSVGSTSQFQVNSSGAIAAATGITSSGTITFSGLTTNGGVVYTNGSGVLAQTAAGTSSQCLLGGGPSWGDCSDAVASSVLWTSGSGAMYPKNSTMDLFVGGSATSSAKFSVLNMTTGTPTASVSATATGTGLSMSGSGAIQSLMNSNLTIGGNTTGNIALMPLNGSGNVGIGTTSPTGKLGIYSSSGADIELLHDGIYNTFPKVSGIGLGGDAVAKDYTSDGGTLNIKGSAQIVAIQSASSGNPTSLAFYTTSGGAVGEQMRIDNLGNVGIGTTNPGAKLDVALSANQMVRLGTTGVASGVALTNGSLLSQASQLQIVGTSTVPISFYTGGTYGSMTAGTERMRLSSAGGLSLGSNYVGTDAGAGNMIISGNVGIGTTSPTGGKLVIKSATAGVPELEILSTTVDDTYGAGIRATGGSNSSSLRLMSSVGTIQLYDASNNYSLNIYNASTLGTSLTGSGNSYFNGGNVGIGTTSPGAKLSIVDTSASTLPALYVSRTASAGDYLTTIDSGTGGNGGLRTSFHSSGANALTTWAIWDLTDNRWEAQATTTVGSTQQIFGIDGSITFNTQASTAVTAGDPITYNTALFLNGNGNVGIGPDTTPDSLFSVGSTSQFQVNSSGAVAAATGLTSSGTITFSGLTTDGGVVYTNGSGVLAQTAAGTSSQCLLGGGPTWGDCSDAVASSVLWTSGSGAVYPKNSTLDLFVGGSATSSAKFSILNINSGTPTASVSATATGTGLSMSGTGTIQSLLNANLTIGGNTTGNIALMPLNGSGNVGIGTTSPTYGLDVIGTGRFTSTANPGLVIGDGSTGTLKIGNALWQDDGTYLSTGTSTRRFYIQAAAVTTYIYTGAIYLGNTTGTNVYLRGNNILGDNFSIPASGVTYFNNGGNVGIGTTSPIEKLDITRTTNGANMALALNKAGAVNDYAGMYIRLPSADQTGFVYPGVYGIIESTSGSNVAGGLAFKVGNQGSTAEQVRIDSSGNVGIGTTSPGAKLSVNGGIVSGSPTAIPSPLSGLSIKQNADAITSGIIWEAAGSSNNGGIFYDDSANSLVLREGGVSTMYINSGNVGIGTTSPEQKLHVSGQSQFIDTSGYNNRAIIISRSIADAAVKSSAITSRHWLNAEEPVTLIGSAIDDSTNSYVNIGGGYSNNNSATGLRFYTAANNSTLTGTQRLTIDSSGNFNFNSGQAYIQQSSGNVGIGTTAPSDILHIAHATDAVLSLQRLSTSAGDTAGIQFKITTDTADQYYQSGIFWERTNDTYNQGGKLHFAMDETEAGNVSASDAKMTLTTAGNVGIGTTSPLALLDVAGNASTSGVLTFRGTTDPKINILNGENFGIQTSVGGDAGLTERLTVLSGGNVGIGTTDPTQKLLVAGGNIQSMRTGTPGGLDGIFLGTTATERPIVSFRASDNSERFKIEQNGTNTVIERVGIFGACGGGCGITEYLSVLGTGNVGIGTTSPLAKLDIAGNASSSGVLSFRGTTDPKINVLNGENFGIRTSVGGDAGLSEKLTILNNGNVGIGTTTPDTKLTINQTADSNGIKIVGYDDMSGENGQVYIDSIGDFNFVSSGQGIHFKSGASTDFALADGFGQINAPFYMLDDKQLYFGSSGDSYIKYVSASDRTDFFDAGAGAGLTISNTGNVGIGTTAPSGLLNVNGAPAGKALTVLNYTSTDQNILTASKSGVTQFNLTNTGVVQASSFYDLDNLTYFLDPAAVGTSLATFGSIASGVSSALSSTAYYADKNSLGNTLMVLNQQGAGDLIAASASGAIKFLVKNNGDVVVGPGGTGKLTATTIDPLYTIDGTRYSTYGTSMVGVKEEVTGKITLSYNGEKQAYAETINLNNQPVGSDLWLFSRVTDPNIDLVSILLTPDSSAKTWYEKDMLNRSITFYSDSPTGLSYRLTAPRFDHLAHGNLSDETDPTITGLIVPPPPSTDGLPAAPITSSVSGSFSNGQFAIGINLDEFGKPIYSLIDSLGNVIKKSGSYSEVLAANIKAGLITAKDASFDSLILTTGNITIAGDSLQNYIAGIVNEILNSRDSTTTSPLATVDKLNVNVISPLAKDANVEIALNGENSKLEVKNSSGSAVASIDEKGKLSVNQASISGALSADQASIVGTLRAKKIIADEIEGLNVQTSTVSAQYITNNNYYVSTPSASENEQSASSSANTQLAMDNGFLDIASFSGQLGYIENLSATYGRFTQGLMAFGPSSFADVSIAGQFSIGGQMVLYDNSINVLGADLQIQPLRQGGINFLSGLLTIDSNGNLEGAGNATFRGTLFAGIISPVSGQDLIVKLNSNEAKDARFEIRNASDSAIFTVNQAGDLIASGAATFGKLNLNLASYAFALSNTEAIATGSAGIATISARQKELTINNDLITEKSLIYITPIGSANGLSPYLLRQVPSESFTIGVDEFTTQPIQFNWLIIN